MFKSDHRRWHRNILSFFLLCGLWLSIGCTPAPVPYPIIDSGQEIVFGGLGLKIIWLDGSRVMFVGLNKEKSYGTLSTMIGIWNIDTGVIETYKSNGRAISCYNPVTNRIVYRTSSDEGEFDDRQWWAGPVGQETRIDEKEAIASPPITCEKSNFVLDANEVLPGKRVYKLLGNHGFLWPYPKDNSVSKRNIPLELHSPSGEKIAELPIGHREVQFITYYIFKQAYFMQRDGVDRNKPDQEGLPSSLDIRDTFIGWWIYPGGKVEMVNIMPRLEMYNRNEGPGGDRFIPTTIGIFVPHFDLDKKKLGGYLIRDKKLVKVVDGWINDATVSPDGCRIAFMDEPDKVGEGNPATLRMIDLCNDM